MIEKEKYPCPKCGKPCWREEVDVGVGYQYGPYHCDNCGWLEWDWRVYEEGQPIEPDEYYNDEPDWESFGK